MAHFILEWVSFLFFWIAVYFGAVQVGHLLGELAYNIETWWKDKKKVDEIRIEISFEEVPEWQAMNQHAFQHAIGHDIQGSVPIITVMLEKYGLDVLQICMAKWIDALADIVGIPQANYGPIQRTMMAGWKTPDGEVTTDLMSIPRANHWAHGMIEARLCDDVDTWQYMFREAWSDKQFFTDCVFTLLDTVTLTIRAQLKARGAPVETFVPHPEFLQRPPGGAYTPPL